MMGWIRWHMWLSILCGWLSALGASLSTPVKADYWWVVSALSVVPLCLAIIWVQPKLLKYYD